MGERDAVEAVIRDQVEALRGGDWPRAYGHAAADVASRLGPGAFRRMVEEGYQPLLEAAAMRVEQVEVDGDEAAARVSLVGPDGSLAGARYELVREDGAWRVAAVILGASLTAVISLNGRGRGSQA
jgi:hypothetical protein